MQLLVLAMLAAAASALPQLPNRPIAILRYQQEQNPIGFYRYSFDTENGIRVQEQGTVIKPGMNDESTAKKGTFTYIGNDGEQYTVDWIADDDGFRASGDHLPTPPPIPEAIQRSLEENEAAGTTFDEQGFPSNGRK